LEEALDLSFDRLLMTMMMSWFLFFSKPLCYENIIHFACTISVLIVCLPRTLLYVFVLST